MPAMPENNCPTCNGIPGERVRGQEDVIAYVMPMPEDNQLTAWPAGRRSPAAHTSQAELLEGFPVPLPGSAGPTPNMISPQVQPAAEPIQPQGIIHDRFLDAGGECVEYLPRLDAPWSESGIRNFDATDFVPEFDEACVRCVQDFDVLHQIIAGRSEGQVLTPTLASGSALQRSLSYQPGLHLPGVGGSIDFSSIKADCDGYTFRWLYWMMDARLWALGYRVFQSIFILQTFECCDGFTTNYVMGYLEAFAPVAGYDRQKNTGLQVEAQGICNGDPCLRQAHDGVRRVTVTRTIKTFIARPTALAVQALGFAPTAIIELAGYMEDQNIGNNPGIDCVEYFSQQLKPGELAGLPLPPRPNTLDELAALIAVRGSGLPGSERDAAISYVAEWDCSQCLSGRFFITSRLDPKFRASRVF
jgi:hypothetical protein